MRKDGILIEKCDFVVVVQPIMPAILGYNGVLFSEMTKKEMFTMCGPISSVSSCVYSNIYFYFIFQ